LGRLATTAENLKYLGEHAGEGEKTSGEHELLAQAGEFTKKFEAAMEDDFNTADAIAAVFELVKLSNSTVSPDSSAAYIDFMKELLEKLCGVLGILTVRKAEALDEEIEAMIEARQQARKAKNFALADEIRGKLLDMGIVLEDTREGVKWKRV
jgi:Cysteinyl-tRNA synthetase